MTKPIKTNQTSKEKLLNNAANGNNPEVTNEELINNLENNAISQSNRNTELSDFLGEKSLINKITENKPDATFDCIKNEGINLALLQYDNWQQDFINCFDRIKSNELKKAFAQEIYEKVQAEIGNNSPYDDFSTECNISDFSSGEIINVPSYFQKIVNYLNEKEKTGGTKKTEKILKKIIIKNEDLNGRLPVGKQIPAGVSLMDEKIPSDIIESFNTLLYFEIGKEANLRINSANDISNKVECLFSNTFPAINTIIGENEKYRYDESKLGLEFQSEFQTINDNKDLSETEKEKQINNLKRKYYINYLKNIDSKIGNAIEELYNNNFDYSKLDKITLKNYLDKVTDIRLEGLSKSGINETLGSTLGDNDMDRFTEFYKELANPDNKEILLDGKSISGSTESTDITIPIKKTIITKENPWLMDIEDFGNKGKSYDCIPFQYKIEKNIIKKLNINDKDKTNLLNLLSQFEYEEDKDNYIIDGENAGALMYLFLIINGKIAKSHIDSEKEEEIKKTLLDNKKENKNGEKEKKSEEERKNDIENFINKIEEYGSGTKFENGTEIWLPMGDSELPGGGYQWMKMKISNIDMKKGTFTGKIFGGELKFNKDIEGKAVEFKMDEKTLNKINKTSKDSNKVWLLPNPDKSDFNPYKNKLNDKLGTGELLFPEGVKWDGQKFMHNIVNENGKEEEQEAKYFGVSGDDTVSYKIKYNPSNRSFKVSTTYNGTAKRNNGKSENVRYSYSRDMDWNNFLIFFTQKGLTPQTEEASQKARIKQDKEFKMVNGGRRKINWFSINNLKNVFKTIKGNIKKKIDDYNKAQDEKLEDILIGDRGLYGKLSHVLGFIPSMKDGLGELQNEYYNERDNRTRKKIEYYLKIFQADPDFGTTFDQITPHAKIQGGKSLQRIITDRVKNAKDRMGDPGLHQAAALLLANFEKGGSPYRGLSAEENTGLWVRALLGKAHYEQFMEDKAKLIKARDKAENGGPGDKKGLNETLAVCEWKYIINNIRGSYKGLIVGSYEERGIPGEDGTNYIDNPAKRLLSDQFANKLESAYKGRFNKGTVDDKYSKFKSNNSFDEMENEFGKSGSTRYQTGEAALRRMIDLATTDDLRKRMKKHFLTYLLSGALDVNCDPGLKKQVYGWAKPMMFVPGLLVKEAGIAENIAILLDDATKGDFSKNVTHYFHRKKQLDGSVEFKKLQTEINNWLTDKNMDKLDDYFSKLPTKDLSGYAEPKLSILKKYQSAMSDSNRDEGDRGILENPKVVSNGLLSSVEVVQKRMNIKKGEFDGKDIDEIKNMKDFRKNVSTDIEKRSTEPRQVAFVLEKFFNRFGIDNQQVYEWIRTADYYDKNRGSFSLPYRGIELNMGNIGDKEIDSILWYAFQGNAWRARGLGCDRIPDELFNTLEAFRNYFSKAFHDGTLLDNYVIEKAFEPKDKDILPLLMGSRDAYDQAFIGDGEFSRMDNSTSEEDLFSGDKDKERKARKNKTKELLKSSDFINSDIANIEKQLKKNLGGTSKQFPTVTSSHSRTLRENFLKGKLAA